jgi:hypothetical protein
MCTLQDKRTSLISILSTEHGRLTREQRDVDKRDLQKALNYGIVSTTWGNRWRIEHDGIIFITDQTMTQEVTAFPSPLAFAPIGTKLQSEHDKAVEVLQHKPEL